MANIIDRANEVACSIEYEHSRKAAEVVREAVAEIERLEAFVADAFEAHCNLDLDVDRIRRQRES